MRIISRNKELMRIYKDLNLVEHLGSGVPRMLESYPKDFFKFSSNFLRMTFPSAAPVSDLADTPQVTPQVDLQVTPQVHKLIRLMDKELSRMEIQLKLKLSDRKNLNENYLLPALQQGLINMTIPDKPNSSKQKYRLTEKGTSLKNTLD